MRRRHSIDAPALVGLGALVVVVGIALALLAQRDHYFFLDEHLAIYGGRAVDSDGIHGLLEAGPYGGRGPERLTGWLVGLVGAVTSTTAGTFRWAKVVLPVAWALVAVPTWALGRLAGLSPRQALLPAALTVASAWSLYGLTLLNTTLGLLTLTLALWATARVAMRPGWRWELGVLAAFALVALARVGNLPFVAVLAPALLAGAWDGRPSDVSRGRWAARLPLRFARTWPILTAIGVAGVVVFVVVGQERLLGSGYGQGISRVQVKPGPLLDVSGVVIGRTALAMGVVPVVLAGWWLLGALAPRRDRATRVVAAIGIGAVLIEIYVLYTAQIEDRYLLPLLPVVAVAASVTVLRSRPSAAGLVGGGAVALAVGWAIWEHGRYVGAPLFDTFFAAGTRFVEVALGGRADRTLGVSATHVLDLAAVVGGLLALALLLVRSDRGVLRARPRLAQLASLALATALVLFGVAGAGWATTRFTRDVGTPNESWSQVAWIDAAVGADAHVGLLVDDDPTRDPLVSADLQDRYLRLSARNAAVRSSVGVDGRLTFPCCEPEPGPTTKLTTDQRTGRVFIDGPRPQLLAVTQGLRQYGFNTSLIAAGDQGFTLERVTRPLALAWVAEDGGSTPDGWSLPGRTLRRRTFPTNAPVQSGTPACWSATLSAPIIDGSLPVRVSGGIQPVTATLTAGAIVPVVAQLPAARRPVVLRIRAGRNGKLVTGQAVGVRVTDDRVGPC